MSDSTKESAIQSEKENLRKSLKRKLRSLSNQQKKGASNLISEKLIETVAENSSVLCYSPLQSEPNIWPAITYWLNSNFRVCLPKVEGQSIESYIIKGTENLTRSSLSILEPDPSKHASISAMEIDFIIVPGIGFSPEGKRIGRGGGYYDRFLGTVSEPTLKVGVAFNSQITADIPTQKHDIPVDLLITN